MRFVCLILLTAILSLCGCQTPNTTNNYLTSKELSDLHKEIRWMPIDTYSTSWDREKEAEDWYKSLTIEQKVIVNNNTRPPRYEIIGIELDKHSANYGEFKYGYVGGTDLEDLMRKYRPIFEPGFDWDVYEKEQYQKWYDSLKIERQIFIAHELIKKKVKHDELYGLNPDGTSSFETHKYGKRFEERGLMYMYKWEWFFEDNIK